MNERYSPIIKDFGKQEPIREIVSIPNRVSKTCRNECKGKKNVECFKSGCPWYDNVDFVPFDRQSCNQLNDDEFENFNMLMRSNDAKIFADSELKDQTGIYHLCGEPMSDFAGEAFENAKRFGLNYPGSPWVRVKLFNDENDESESDGDCNES